MKQVSKGMLATLLIIALLVGGLSTYLFIPREVVTVQEVVKEVEVTKEVPVNVTVIKEVPSPSQLDLAVSTFMEAVDNEEDEAGNDINLQNGYDFADISISKISKDYSVVFSEKGDKETVEFEITLKYDEAGDHDRGVKETYSVKVTYEEDEDTIVQVL